MASPKICRIDDCGKKAHAHGLCFKHYERLRSTGDPLGIRPKPARHVGKWVQSVCLGYQGDDCLIWPFSRLKKTGYAVWSDARKGGQSASRVICERVHGPPPGPWYQAAHSCGRGCDGCVNPRHLSWSTPIENHADKRRHGTLVKGTKHYRSTLTDEQVEEIRRMAGQVPQISFARKFGVSRSAISRIVLGQSYV